MPKPNNNIPKWVLLDQLHLDISIRTDLPAKTRRDLKSLLNSPSLTSLFETIIVGPHRKSIKVKVSR